MTGRSTIPARALRVGLERARWRTTVAAVGVALVAAACGSTSPTTSSGSSTTKAPSAGALKIGFFGALTGANAQLGININDGVKLALTQYQSKGKGPAVTLEEYDSQGDPSQAPQLAQKAISDHTVAVVGPAFSGESKTADPIFQQAGIVSVTPSATDPTLAQHGWTYWHRIVGNDNTQGPAAASLIAKKLGAKRVAVIDDASAYGKGIADIVRSTLPTDGVTVVSAGRSIDPNATDYSATVDAVKAANVDVIYYGGYYAAAGRLLKQMRDAGVKATFVSDDGVNDPKFVAAAGQADADGSYVTCPCGDVTGTTAGQAFTSAYQAAFHVAPGTYSAEGYDAANIILTAISGGSTTASAINSYLASHTFPGITKTVKFDASGDISGGGIYAYQVKAGSIVSLGLVSQLVG
ncbi:MAG TPA: branched-chain amino acid ABC transporter substrate-binding protein [Acidimicrobiales bacterium]|jgi:branched-chain amino acid transport system substrate-binding protein|nr:branched-chain amino acid ABC transporter substrate-binding protein [Acidimicrobiales bacterium]